MAGCSKDSPAPVTPTPPPPPVEKTVRISNLQYSPAIVGIKLYSPSYTITGTINFMDANGGIVKLRLSTSAGGDTTISITEGAGVTSGTLTGIFEFVRPALPMQYNFEVWVIDAKGKESNKLTGTVEVIYDDRAESWWSIHEENHMMNKVAWLNNQYIAVGQYGRIETSANGASWTPQNSQVTEELRGIAWNGTQYIATGTKHTILASADAVNWNIITQGAITDGYLQAVAASPSTFVVVGSVNFYGPSYPEILASTDGKTWSVNLFSVQTLGGVLRSVIWSGSQFVAVGQGQDGDHDYLLILTSPDGFNWTDRSIHTPWVALYDVIWTGSQLVAVGGNVIAISADGINWNVNQVTGMQNIRSIVYTGKKYVAVGNGSSFISVDALNWNQIGSGSGYVDPTDRDYFKSIAWSPVNYNYVAVGTYFYSYNISP